MIYNRDFFNPALLNTKQTMQYLSINNHRYLKYLVKRKLLKRMFISPQQPRYNIYDLDVLLRRVKREGINLCFNPNRKK